MRTVIVYYMYRFIQHTNIYTCASCFSIFFKTVRVYPNSQPERYFLPARKYPVPPWQASSGSIKEWPAFRSPFKHAGFLKTAEMLLLSGDAGAYIMEYIDIDASYAALFIRLFRMIHLLQYKDSTPGDRQTLSAGLPALMTELEMAMPIIWNTPVVHIFTYHTVDSLTRCGPYPVHNMLDIERFHTRFKSYARGTRNIMQSIRNHHGLAEVASGARLHIEEPWTDGAARSTAAGHAARSAGALRTSRYAEALGTQGSRVLTLEELNQIQELWAVECEDYADFVQRYEHLNARRPRKERYANINEWVTDRRTPQECKWLKMSREVTV